MTSIQITQEVLDDIAYALECDDQYDVIIRAGHEGDIADLQAHSFVLRARSSYFRRILKEPCPETDECGRYIYQNSNIAPSAFRVILRYFYTGWVPWEQVDKDVLLQTLNASDELGVVDIVHQIQDYFVKNPKSLKEDIVKTLLATYQYESLCGLRDYILEMIAAQPELLYCSRHFKDLDKDIVTMVLKREDLQLNQVEKWNLLLRWVNLHYFKLGNVHSKLSTDDLTSAQHAIKEHLPLFNFSAMSREDFFISVYPYNDLLPPDLLEKLCEHFQCYLCETGNLPQSPGSKGMSNQQF